MEGWHCHPLLSPHLVATVRGRTPLNWDGGSCTAAPIPAIQCTTNINTNKYKNKNLNLIGTDDTALQQCMQYSLLQNKSYWDGGSYTEVQCSANACNAEMFAVAQYFRFRFIIRTLIISIMEASILDVCQMGTDIMEECLLFAQFSDWFVCCE